MGRAQTCIELQKPRKFSVIECSIGTEHGHWPPTYFCLDIFYYFSWFTKYLIWVPWSYSQIIENRNWDIGFTTDKYAKQRYRNTFTIKMTPFEKPGTWWRRWHGFASVTGQTRAVEDDECGLGGRRRNAGGGCSANVASHARHRLHLTVWVWSCRVSPPLLTSTWGTSLLSIIITYDLKFCCYSICKPLPWCP